MSGIMIEPVDLSALSAADWQAICDLLNPYRHEIDPRLTLLDVAEAQRRYRTLPSYYRGDYWRARSVTGELVGWLQVGRMVAGNENYHLLDMDIIVAAPWRRQGIGSALLAEAVAVAEAENRKLLDAAGNTRIPAGTAFLTRIGGKRAMRHVTNELALADLDRDLVHDWIARAPQRAGDYVLDAIASPIAADLLPAIADLFQLMNSAPLEDLDAEPEQWTAERVAEMDRNLQQRGAQMFMLAARHKPSGRYVGYTIINYMPFQPQFLFQDDTAVDPQHRDKGLGRWLKAANLLRVIEACPAAEVVWTGNAGSNAPMLSINHALGFREAYASDVFQTPVAAARAYLDERAHG